LTAETASDVRKTNRFKNWIELPCREIRTSSNVDPMKKKGYILYHGIYHIWYGSSDGALGLDMKRPLSLCRGVQSGFCGMR